MSSYYSLLDLACRLSHLLPFCRIGTYDILKKKIENTEGQQKRGQIQEINLSPFLLGGQKNRGPNKIVTDSGTGMTEDGFF
jgi:hypothetical protein